MSASMPLGPDDRRLLVALAHLPGLGPARLRTVVAAGIERAWGHLADGREPDGGPLRSRVGAAWRSQVRQLDAAALWQRHVDAGVTMTVIGDPGHPVPPDPSVDDPVLLFWRGPAAPAPGLDGPAPGSRPTVALVGTRRATRYGIEVAQDLGRRLSAAGVVVVSGLALGIDAAAHAGSLAVADGAPPLAVVAGGVDVVYPARNRELWRAVERQGAVVSEVPLGERPERWRFPARNRIIVALSSLVVVVESHRQGGSLLTAGFAAERGVDVWAVPGPVTSAASAGSNGLLLDGCAPCLAADDVLLALGMVAAGPDPAGAAGDGAPSGRAIAALSDVEVAVVDALASSGSSVGEVVDVVGRGFGEVSLALIHLEELGFVAVEHGRYARTARCGS